MKHPSENLIASLILAKIHGSHPHLRQQVEKVHLDLLGTTFTEAATGARIIVSPPGIGRNDMVKQTLHAVSEALGLPLVDSHSLDQDALGRAPFEGIALLTRQANDPDAWVPRGLPNAARNTSVDAKTLKNAVLVLDIVEFDEHQIGRGKLHEELCLDIEPNQLKIATLSTILPIETVTNKVQRDGDKLRISQKEQVQVAEFNFDGALFVAFMKEKHADALSNPGFSRIIQAIEDASHQLFTLTQDTVSKGSYASPRSYQVFLSAVRRDIDTGVFDKTRVIEMAHDLLGEHGALITTAHLGAPKPKFLENIEARRSAGGLLDGSTSPQPRSSSPS